MSPRSLDATLVLPEAFRLILSMDIAIISPTFRPETGVILPADKSGTVLAQNNRFSMPIVAGIQQVSVVYANWYHSTAAGDSADSTPVEVKNPIDIMLSAAIHAKIDQLTVPRQGDIDMRGSGQWFPKL